MTQPKLTVINNIEALYGLLLYLKKFEYVAYDVETTGLTSKDEIIGFSVCVSEEEAFYLILSEWNPKTQTLDQVGGSLYSETVCKIIEALVGKKLIMHNSVFDCYMTESYFKVKLMDSVHTDTLILAHLLNENRRVGLKELAASMYGESSTQEQAEMKASVIANGGKLTKAEYQMYKANGELLGKYGAKDAWLTYKLFLDLVPELYEQDLDKFFYEEESMPLLRGPTYQLNTTGIQIDTSRLLSLKKTLEAECLEAKTFIHKEIYEKVKTKYPATNQKNTFNIGSNQQLSWLLFGQYELEFSKLTKSGKAACKSLGLRPPYTKSARRDFILTCINNVDTIYQPEAVVNGKKIRAKKYGEPWRYIEVDKKTLKSLAHKYKWIERLLEYKQKEKLLKTYVEGTEKRLSYGIIRPRFLQHGTTSGRYSSRDPNYQNLPRNDQRIKECCIARHGKVFVSADFSQLEPRVFAYYSGDERLMKAFGGTTDFYSVVGIEVTGKYDALPLKEGHPDAFGVKYKGLRDMAKTIALAVAYGATAFQLAPVIGKNVDDTEKDVQEYLERFPGVKKMMLDAHKIAKETGQVLSYFGRPRRIPAAKDITRLYGKTDHQELPYEMRSLLNLATNHRIQSTGASIVNRAAIRFYNDCKELGLDARLISQIHDELVVECKEQDAETTSVLLQNAMETTTVLPDITFEAIPRISKNLSK
jgi:DNA polymerase I-like protein with 3'-5' exonuclease and polymerase domains